MIGVVLAMFEVGVLITSTTVSLAIQKVGRKNFIMMGSFIMIAASVGFGMLAYVVNDHAFLGLSMLMRFL